MVFQKPKILETLKQKTLKHLVATPAIYLTRMVPAQSALQGRLLEQRLTLQFVFHVP